MQGMVSARRQPIAYRTMKRKQERFLNRKRLLMKRGVVNKWGWALDGFENDPRVIQLSAVEDDYNLASYIYGRRNINSAPYK